MLFLKILFPCTFLHFLITLTNSQIQYFLLVEDSQMPSLMR